MPQSVKPLISLIISFNYYSSEFGKKRNCLKIIYIFTFRFGKIYIKEDV